MPPLAKTKRHLFVARPLLVAGAGLVAAVMAGSCGGGPGPVGNLKPPPTCDAGVCLPDGGRPADAGIDCNCPLDAGP